MLDDQSTESVQLDELQIVIPVALLRRVSQIAIAKGITTEEAIKEAIAQYLEKQKS